MLITAIRKYILLNELILLPFILMAIIIYHHFGLKFDYFPAFLYWLLLIIIIFFGPYLSFYCLAKSLDLNFSKKYWNIKVDSVKAKAFIRTLLSLAIVLVVYENLQYIINVISPIDQDAALLYYDTLIFGSLHPTLLLQSYINPFLTEWLNFSYLSFFFYLPILAIVFYLKNLIKAWELLVLTITLTLFSGYLLYVFFPAVGPGVYLSNQFTFNLDGGLVSGLTNGLVNTQGFPRGTFPSLHTACSIVYLYFAFVYSRKIFYMFLPVIISLIFSTIYLRHHYVIDLWAGLFLAIIAIFASRYFYEKWNNN